MALISKVRFEEDPNMMGEVGSLAAPFVAETTRHVLNRATTTAPRKTGNLANSHQMTMKARRLSITGRVETRVKYAMPVHEGTGPYTIKARRKKALAFYWPKVGMVTVVPKGKGIGTGVRKSKRKGVRFFIGKGYVTHPRMRGRPWLRRALEEVALARGFIFVPTSGRDTSLD